VNRQPTGLLGYFGIKNGGKNPQSLSETLLPQLDLLDWYLNTAPQFATTTGTIAAGANVITVAPPAGEAWHVTHYGVWADTGVGDTIGALFVVRFNYTNTITIPVTDSTNAVASTTTVRALRDPQWLMPGESLGFGAWTVVGTSDVYTYVRYTILPL
jgi:hypothetical protein